MKKNPEEFDHYSVTNQADSNIENDEISNEERHSKNAEESAIVQEYPRIDTENL